MINKVFTQCNTCKLFKKRILWPAVGLSKAMDSNDTMNKKDYGIYISLMCFQDLVIPQ